MTCFSMDPLFVLAIYEMHVCFIHSIHWALQRL
jgi:hypothetical protein